MVNPRGRLHFVLENLRGKENDFPLIETHCL